MPLTSEQKAKLAAAKVCTATQMQQQSTKQTEFNKNIDNRISNLNIDDPLNIDIECAGKNAKHPYICEIM